MKRDIKELWGGSLLAEVYINSRLPDQQYL